MMAAGIALARKRLLYIYDNQMEGTRGKRRTHVGKSAGRQPHGSGAHDRRTHDQQVRVGILHASPDLMDKR